jgi:hypothetical protein
LACIFHQREILGLAVKSAQWLINLRVEKVYFSTSSQMRRQMDVRSASGILPQYMFALNPSCDSVVAHPATAIIIEIYIAYENTDEIREDAGVHID